jgi:hypothetical protein
MVKDTLQGHGDRRSPGELSLRPGEHPAYVVLRYQACGAGAQDGHMEPLRRGHVEAGKARKPLLR